MDIFNDLFRGGLSGKLPYIVLFLLLVFFAWRMFGPAPVAAGEVMTPQEAHEKALKGEVVLVDVRTAQEWQQTGLHPSRHANTKQQQRPDFVAQLVKALGGDRSRAMAVICRTATRTAGRW